MIMYSKNGVGNICFGLRIDEMQCQCSYEGCTAVMIAEATKEAYKKFRKTVGIPLIIKSGNRCPQHNQDEGGVELSRHQTGEGMDISYVSLESTYTPEDVIELLRDAGFTFVIWYPKKRIFHADTRPKE